MKQTRKSVRLFAALVCFVLLFSACTQQPPVVEHERERRTIPYSEMHYQRPDIETVKARIVELTGKVEEADTFEEVMEYDDELTALIEDYDSMHSLANLARYHNSQDEALEEEVQALDEGWVEIELLVNDFNRFLVEGPYADDYKAEVGDYMFKAIENDLLLSSPEVEEYKKERSRLNNEYNSLIANLTVTYEGEEYGLSDIYAVADYDLYVALVDLFFNQNAEQFAQLYARMIQLDKDTAETLGFASAAEYYYLSYSRDYGPEEAQQLIDNVKEYFVPMTLPLYMQSFNSGEVEREAAFETMPQALAAVDEELVEAWEFMQQYGLNDTEALDTKQSGIAFTTSIPSYDAPFLYMCWDDAFSSTSTLMHEFGHFYDFWLRYDVSTVFNLDIAEVYSQGLELLLQKEYSLFTEYGEEAAMENLADMATGAIMYQCLLEEFQLRAFELETLDAASIGQLYAELLAEYNLEWSIIPDANGADNTWFTVTHLFDSPFYTISYVTSAVAALQIWNKGQDKWDNARDTYLELIHADQNQPFTTLLEDAGLRAVHEDAVLRNISKQYAELFELEDYLQQAA